MLESVLLTLLFLQYQGSQWHNHNCNHYCSGNWKPYKRHPNYSKDITNLEVSGDRVLIHVNIVLVEWSHDELVTLRLHPSGNKRGQVEPWCPIQHQLIIYYLICCILWYGPFWHLEPVLHHNITTEKSHFFKKNFIVCFFGGEGGVDSICFCLEQNNQV